MALLFSTLLFLGIALPGISAFTVGVCDYHVVLIEMAACKANFVQSMNSSANGRAECLKFYEEAKDCFNETVVNHCFVDLNNSNNHNVIYLKAVFGDQSHFCEDGLLRPITQALDSIHPNNCTGPNHHNVSECEYGFRDMFFDQFSKDSNKTYDLCSAYKSARLCQTSIAISCKIGHQPQNAIFFDRNPFNPYCSDFIESIEKTHKEIEQGAGPPARDNATIITIVLVGVILLVILSIAFYLLWRRDQDRAEIRAQKRASKKAANNGEQQPAPQELQPLSDNTKEETQQAASLA